MSIHCQIPSYSKVETQIINPSTKVTWKRYGGYYVDSKGDRRFSAFFATMPDGRSIEYHYQVYIKGFPSIKEGKGKPPLNPNINLYEEYLKLWKIWAKSHDKLLSELMLNISKFNYVLSDRFATTEVNQAHALADILNERQNSLELK